MKKILSITMLIIGILGLGSTYVDAAPYKYHGYIYEGGEFDNIYYKNKDNTQNKAKIYMRSDSENVTYSIEYDARFEGAGTDDYDDTFDYRQTKLTKSQTDRMNLIGYYGYNYKDELYDHTDKKWYAITQYMIWKEEDGNNLDSIVDVNGNKIFIDEIKEMENLLNRHYIKPDFGTRKFETKIYDKLTIEDKNNIMSEYSIRKINNANYEIHDNKIDITPTKEDVYTLSFSKKDNRYNNSATFFISENYGNAMQIGKFETITTNVIITSIAGKVFITNVGEQLVAYQDNKFIY
ncbi:MAG: thioester domain-containing protein, partial [Bacilli bacterium]|nr:thioester domain-containing protein [Bacilli bacterium]